MMKRLEQVADVLMGVTMGLFIALFIIWAVGETVEHFSL